MSLCPTLPVVRLKDRKTLIAVLLNPEMNFGDLYSQGDIDVEGDLVQGAGSSLPCARPPYYALAFALAWMDPVLRVAALRARISITTTIFQPIFTNSGLIQSLYTHALTSRMRTQPWKKRRKQSWTWSAASSGCRPGETVVEAGCGWGALSLHMAREYGVRVKAFNISHEQIAFAREQAKREGLESRVEFIEDDYRNIAAHYDAFVSVGMLEHIGREHYQELGNVIHRSIGDTGRGLLHFIGKNQPQPFSVWIRKRIFPGAYTPTLREAMDVLEPHDFSVLDVENLRMHYARTIEFWLQRYERHFDQVAERFGLAFARMWRLYLAGSIAGFRVGTLQLFQLVFAGRACKSQPLTRAHFLQLQVNRIHRMCNGFVRCPNRRRRSGRIILRLGFALVGIARCDPG